MDLLKVEAPPVADQVAVGAAQFARPTRNALPRMTFPPASLDVRTSSPACCGSVIRRRRLLTDQEDADRYQSTYLPHARPMGTTRVTSPTRVATMWLKIPTAEAGARGVSSTWKEIEKGR